MGRLLEANHGRKLDEVQMHFTDLCRDDRISSLLRLRVLEILELRSLDWKTNPDVESFYREKISKIEDNNMRRTLSSTSQGPKSPEEGKSATSSQRVLSSSGDILESKIKESCLVVNIGGKSAKLFLSSDDPELVINAKTVLAQYFASKSASGSPGVQYSREDLFSLGEDRNSSGWDKPTNWEKISASIPEIVKKI